MTYGKQVDSSHYEFSSYMTKERWASVWYQLHEVQKLAPCTVLEVGPGSGIFKAAAFAFGISVDTLDIDPDLKPEYVGSVTAMPFSDGTYDVVCAFQMLEHLPYEVSLKAFRELARVSRCNIVISLPDARIAWRFLVHIPLIGPRGFLLNRPQLRAREPEFDGEHYWEINKQGYPLSRVINDFSKEAQLLRTYRVPDVPEPASPLNTDGPPWVPVKVTMRQGAAATVATGTASQKIAASTSEIEKCFMLIAPLEWKSD